MKNFNIFKLKYAIAALFLMVFTAGCDDQMVGIEGYCPEVQSTYPANSATNVGLNEVITVTFAGKMNPATIIGSSFVLSDNSSPKVTSVKAKALNISGAVTYDDNTNTMSFTPDAPLTTGAVYTGTVNTDVQDPIGNAMLEDYVWTFTTDDAPQVESTDPADQALDVPLNQIVTATFTQEMDPATLDQTSFTLFDGAIQINGSVSYSNLTVSFDPDTDLTTGTTYTATITTDAENETGIALQADYVWTFSTEAQAVTVLGTAETYGLMATSAITNIGNTIINGDVSLDPGTSMTGFPPGIVNGTININNTESAQARADLLDAYNYYKNLPPGTNVPAGADLGALYPTGIAPGTYTSGSTMLVSTTLVLDAGGDPNAVWVFQIGSSLTTGADIILANGANENNVFWVPTEDATIGVGSTFNGTIVSGRDVTANTGAIINGRILAGAITAGTIALDGNTVNVPGF